MRAGNKDFWLAVADARPVLAFIASWLASMSRGCSSRAHMHGPLLCGPGVETPQTTSKLRWRSYLVARLRTWFLACVVHTLQLVPSV